MINPTNALEKKSRKTLPTAESGNTIDFSDALDYLGTYDIVDTLYITMNHTVFATFQQGDYLSLVYENGYIKTFAISAGDAWYKSFNVSTGTFKSLELSNAQNVIVIPYEYDRQNESYNPPQGMNFSTLIEAYNSGKMLLAKLSNYNFLTDVYLPLFGVINTAICFTGIIFYESIALIHNNGDEVEVDTKTIPDIDAFAAKIGYQQNVADYNKILRINNTGVVFCDVEHNYSTEEQVVGKWIDGKPLYEKTVQFNVTGSGDQKYNINNILENHETILTYNIVGLDNDDKYVTTYYASSTSYLGTWINSTREFVVTTGINPPKPITLYVTFRYTKTSATPT